MMRITQICLVLLLACVPVAARADAITIFVALAEIIGTTAAAFVVSYGAYIAYAGLVIYGSAQARSRARRAASDARNAYNASLQDRNVSVLSTEPPMRYVLGKAWTGGSVVAMFTTDKQGRRTDDGIPYTRKDGLKHIVIVWAAHECQAIHELAFEGVPIGDLDADGYAMNWQWLHRNSDIQVISPNGPTTSVELGEMQKVVSVALVRGNVDWKDRETIPCPEGGTYGWSMSGTQLVLPTQLEVPGSPGLLYDVREYDKWEINYAPVVVNPSNPGGPPIEFYSGPDRSALRVKHHLGTPGDAADTYLMSIVPTLWTANHKLAGLCYSVITLDLERQEFQSGPSGWTAQISGLKVLDPRTGVTAWTENNALLINWYLQHKAGFKLPASDIDSASVIAAANACDEVVNNYPTWAPSLQQWVYGPQKRYTMNGVIEAGMDREAVLQDMAESMNGWVYPTGDWVVQAGVWEPPVMDLTDDDLFGSIDIIQAGEPEGELFNSVRGQFIDGAGATAGDMSPYVNSTFLAADGEALWQTLDLPFTNSDGRANHIARVQVEHARNGLMILFPGKLRVWGLRPGHRVRVTSAEYGFNLKHFRVTDWTFGLRSPVALALQEDSADVYDMTDATLADPTPNTTLPSPVDVPTVSGISLASGTAQLIQLGDGTVLTRVQVAWSEVRGAYMSGGSIEVRWRVVGERVWSTVSVSGDDRKCYLTGVRDGDGLIIAVTAINGLGYRGTEVWLEHLVLGKTEPPSPVSSLTATVVPGAVRISWTPCAELDYAETQLRVGASWAAGTPLPRIGPASSYDWLWPSLGNYTVWAKHFDTTGNASVAVFTPVAVTAAIFVPGSSVVPDAGWLNSNIGLPRGQALSVNPECNLPAEWNKAGSGAFTFVTGVAGVPYQTGVGNTAGTGGQTLISKTPTPIDLSRRLRVSAFAYSNNGTGLARLGVAWVDAAGALINSGVANPVGWTNGAFSYFGLVDQTPPAAGQRYVQEFGAGVSGVAIPSNAVAALLVYLPNYSNTGGARHYVTDFKIEDITEVANAQATATAAAAAASAAGTNATSALNRLAAIDSDGILSRGDKSEIIKAWNAVTSESSGIDAQAGALGITTERSAYSTAYYSLSSYLSGLSPSYADTSQDTTIIPAIDLAAWNNYYSARQTVLNAIAAKAATLASWAGVSGSGKPADNATKNTHYYQDTDPGAVDDGSIWISSTKAWQRVSGTWQPYVGNGSVDTGQLALGAATAIIQDTNDFGGSAVPGSSSPSEQRTVNYTPAVDCIINFSATIAAAGVFPDSGNQLYWAVSIGGGADVILASCSTNSSGRQTFAGISSFGATGGVSLSFKLVGNRPTGNPAILLYQSSIRVEVIKR